MAEYICIAETYQGHKIAVRDFAKTKEEARENLIKIFPQYYIGKAMNVREYREYIRKYSIDENEPRRNKNMNNIEQLEERITQLTELVKSGSEAIKSMEAALRAAEEERDRLADQRREQESKFEIAQGEKYYFVDFHHKGCDLCVKFDVYVDALGDKARVDQNNCFKTRERAEEVLDKINLLLKLERLHDIYCPDYKAEDDGKETYQKGVFGE